MKNTKIQEIENFVNGLEQSYLSEHQMMTLTVNPEEVVGGASTNSRDCKNETISCRNSKNERNCTNDVWCGCGASVNSGSCQNKIK